MDESNETTKELGAVNEEMFVSNNTFRIPDNVVLVEDKAEMEQLAALEDGRNKLLEEINDIWTQIINERNKRVVLRQRIRDFLAYIKCLGEMESLNVSVVDPQKDAGLHGAVPDSVEVIRSQITESTLELIKALEMEQYSDSSDNELL